MRLPTLRILRTRYPDLAGVLMRDWQRQGCLVAYHYHWQGGFRLVGLRPRWRWVIRLVFGFWVGQWGRHACWSRVVLRRKGTAR